MCGDREEARDNEGGGGGEGSDGGAGGKAEVSAFRTAHGHTGTASDRLRMTRLEQRRPYPALFVFCWPSGPERGRRRAAAGGGAEERQKGAARMDGGGAGEAAQEGAGAPAAATYAICSV